MDKTKFRRTLAAILALTMISAAAPLLPGLDSGVISAEAVSGRDKLSEKDLWLYDKLKEKAINIAAGKETSTEFSFPIDDFKLTWTAAELGVSSLSSTAGQQAILNNYFACFDYDTQSIIEALLADCPYEFFWYDQTQGGSFGGTSCSYSIRGNTVTYSVAPVYQAKMIVSSDYTDNNNSYKVKRSRHGGIDSVTMNAVKIVDKYADKNDYQKLLGYATEIINLVDYNDDAAAGGYSYGDPWQLINVFDGDSSTNVVCEGYSKAFKYLCDLTDFDSDNIECHLVSGTLQSGSTNGGHMWNVVTMDNQKTYLTDVTNSDNFYGATYYLLKGGSPYQNDSIYYFNNAFFIYYDSTISMWGYDILTLDTKDYSYRMSESHTVTVDSDIKNCKVTPSATSVKGGEKVILTVTPNSGYELIDISASNAKVRKTSNTSYYFYMPSTASKVSAIVGKYVAQSAGSCSQGGVKAHYEGSDGKFYIKQNGEFIEVSENDLYIASSGSHTYSDPVWNWNNINNVTLKITCTSCGTSKTGTATVTSSTQNGITTYTATAVIDGTTYVDTRQIVDYTITGTSLTVNGDISLNAYILPSDYVNTTGAYVTVKGPYDTTAVKKSLADLPYLDGYGYMVSYNINAQDIDKTVTFNLYNSNGTNQVMHISSNSSVVYNNGYSKSVKDYINAVLSGDYSEDLQNLAASLNIYGNLAKAYFNDDFTATAAAPSVSADKLAPYKRTNSEGFDPTECGYYGHSLLLESKTALRLYFEENTDISNISIGKGSEPVEFAKGISDDGMRFIEISDIPAQELDTMFTVYFGNGNTMNVSALGYAYNVLSNYSDDSSRSDLCELMKALYNYNQCAKAYFA